MHYHNLCDLLQRQAEAEDNGELTFLPFNRTLDHRQVSPTNKNYAGSRYNLKIEWSDGSITWEPLGVVSKDDP